jgi:hypothetical protein
MDRAYSTHVRYEKFVQNFGRKISRTEMSVGRIIILKSISQT